MAPNLSLPDRAPELGQYGDFNWDLAVFALYTLVGDSVSLEEVAHILRKPGRDEGDEVNLVRPAPHVGPLRTLQDVVDAHIALDKGKRDRSDAISAGNLDWYPLAFIVVVQERWKEPGGLFYADEDGDYALHKFFFRIDDAYVMLSNIGFGDEDLATAHETYAREHES